MNIYIVLKFENKLHIDTKVSENLISYKFELSTYTAKNLQSIVLKGRLN